MMPGRSSGTLFWSLLPPDRTWWCIDGAILAAGVLFVALHAGAPATTAAPPTSAGRAPADLTPQERAQLAAMFPGCAAGPEQQREFLDRLSLELVAAGMVLQSHTMEQTIRDQYPPRHVHRFQITGPAPAHASFLGFLAATSDPVRIRDVTWGAGRGTEGPVLDLVLELLIAR